MATHILRRLKYPLRYEVTPEEIEEGFSWVTLKLKNIGKESLIGLDIQLHSLDTYKLTVFGTGGMGAGQYLTELGPNKEKEFAFRVNALDRRMYTSPSKDGRMQTTSGGNPVGRGSGWSRKRQKSDTSSCFHTRIRSLERPSRSRQP